MFSQKLNLFRFGGGGGGGGGGGFTPCKTEQSLQGMGLNGKQAQKYQSIHEIRLERTYSWKCLLILDLKPFRL